MKPCPLLLILLAAVTMAAATSDGSRNVFSLLPKSLQKKPLVDLNIITEMTPEGRRSPPATPAAPVYYISKSGGAFQFGKVLLPMKTRPPSSVWKKCWRRPWPGPAISRPPRTIRPRWCSSIRGARTRA